MKKNAISSIISLLVLLSMFSCTVQIPGNNANVRYTQNNRQIEENEARSQEEIIKEYNLDEFITKDNRGNTSVKKDSFGKAIIDNGKGDKIEVERDSFGNSYVKDKNGKRIKISKGFAGRTVIEDEKGNKSEVVDKDIFGNITIKDSKGNKFKVTKDIFGDTYVEDEKGNKKKVKSDIFGRIELE
ncbi:hypothetical protein GGR21_003444 [Dysgonomonas hofstadii]|uniref:Lipoprotein n=1 Tax=Dysgonomonas hofstadii TaxID=637886 RepID=A0A840CN64_9BACT|nr:hypothetical protein [Dysgonomonas hofstadii]MBB4037527.1 hypothetical protein [Dysgonomonas hofstadii]